jgi:hypothetical protein
MKKYLLIVLLVGVCFGQIIPDTLVTKYGKTYTGSYYSNDGYFIEFKFQKSKERSFLETSDVKKVILSSGMVVYVEKTDSKLENDENRNTTKRLAPKQGSMKRKSSKQIIKEDYDQKKPNPILINDKNSSKLIPAMRSGLGIGIGLGYTGPTFTLSGLGTLNDGIHEIQIFGHFGGTMSLNRSSDDTYEFTDELFNDSDRGEYIEETFIIIGSTLILERGITGYFGAGIVYENKMLKRYDSSQILGTDGIYYIEDDDYRSNKPTFHLGISFPLGPSATYFDYMGIYLNTKPLNFSVIGWIGY